MNPRQNILIIAGAGIGGTEKCATIFAKLLHKRGYKVGYIASPGPRLYELEKEGVTTFRPTTDPVVLAEIIKSFGATIIHQHVPGYAFNNTLYRSLDILKNKQIKLIETNVFGRIEDAEGWEKVDFRMFISSASAVQAFKRAGLTEKDNLLSRHTVVYYPMLADFKQFNNIDSQAFRSELGVSEDEILFFRIGQPSIKWTLWEYEAYKLIKKKVPNARFLMMEPPENLWKKIEKEANHLGIILKKTTNDFNWLNRLNHAADISLHASAFGESFGYTIAEAMYGKKPVITRSTPWGDNAQVELVHNGITGFVCMNVGEMARRAIELSQDKILRTKMGEAARKRIIKISDPECETDVLQAVIKFVTDGSNIEALKKRTIEVVEFSRTFKKREYCFSEHFLNHPFEKTLSGIFLLYKCTRGYIRNIKGRCI